jgi:hypothetical protein
MANELVVHLDRTNLYTCNLGIDITGETITSEIRTQPETDATLVATFAVAVVDAPTGEITLTLDNSVTAGITVRSGYMDLKRVSGGEPLPVFDRPLEVRFSGSVTA